MIALRESRVSAIVERVNTLAFGDVIVHLSEIGLVAGCAVIRSAHTRQTADLTRKAIDSAQKISVNAPAPFTLLFKVAFSFADVAR